MRIALHGLLVLGAFVVALMPAAATANSKSTAGTLTMNATLPLRHGWESPSSTGVCEQADDCAARTFRGDFPGLGQVDGRYDFPMDACGALDARAMSYPIRLAVVGKGDIPVTVAEATACVSAVVDQPQTFAVTGGTGSYAGASGSGTLTRRLSRPGPTRSGSETWTGALEVPGLEFDLTPPTLSGATSKTVRAPKGAKRVRVTYKVAASDNVDG